MTPELAPLPPPSPPPPYHSAHKRARVVIVLLWIGMAVHAISIPVDLVSLVLPQVDPNQEPGENLGGLLALMLQGVLGLLILAVYIATVVFFLMWLHRCCTNLRAFGINRRLISHSPGWAVGSFFVPFANLVVPYRAVKELWQKSEIGTEESLFSSSISPPGFFPAWWGFWLAANFAGNIYFRLSMAEAPREAVTVVSIVADVLSIVAAYLAIMVVRDIDRRQEESARRLPGSQSGPLPPPPPVFEPSGSPAYYPSP